MTAGSRLWGVVPAAGTGRRFGSEVPKQYLFLGEKRIIEHSLAALFGHPAMRGVALALATDDPWWDEIRPQPGWRLWRAPGGAERCDSVANALEVLAGMAPESDWVLVHDAARPCLRAEDLERLVDRVLASGVGGLLAVPVRDTMKRADGEGRVRETVDRDGLWHAQTPQMFRLGELRRALAAVRERGLAVTDEAAAMELAGVRPLLVPGHADNLKITHAEDLPLARFHLAQQGRLA